ncbi:MAG: glutamine amidotransferase, partial [bacterium]|nr:glutamine amidotransferase [bacterium]
MKRSIYTSKTTPPNHTRLLTLLLLCLLTMCAPACSGNTSASQQKDAPKGKILNAGFVCVEKVFNSELIAPYDILQHSVYRDPDNYIRCFIVTPDGKPFLTAEGIRITPDYSFQNVPPIDILLIPSTETSMSSDLENKPFMDFLKRSVQSASHVVTLCDGAFPLVATGAVDGRVVTTFPGDRQKLADKFPKVEVRFDVNFVVDGKYITSVGGALSYEPALYLVEKLYSTEHAKRSGQGL